ncbi:GNAT family N-acetyltransferase [Sagittula sp. NFXS13]|uniref:acyl-homoserine-lactone synthase n=1 Tax=Sagittula sp. NFXS13 TaxID=2819095 RepID=UPI0032DEAB2D
MFTLLQNSDFAAHAHLLDAAFRLRKKVFADQLGWDVPVTGDREFDRYDDDAAQYLVWCSADRQNLYGLVRLIPTSAPTLLFDVFGATHGNDPALVSDTTFEGTRMCLDDDRIAEDFPNLGAGAGFGLLLLALCEAGLALGIDRLVSNFEPAMSRIYKRAGLGYHLHGKADGYGARPVCCASFDVTRSVLSDMRAKLGIDLPVFKSMPGFTPLPQAPRTLEAAL